MSFRRQHIGRGCLKREAVTVRAELRATQLALIFLEGFVENVSKSMLSSVAAQDTGRRRRDHKSDRGLARTRSTVCPDRRKRCGADVAKRSARVGIPVKER